MSKGKVRLISPVGAFSINAVIGLLDNLLVSRIPMKDVQDDIRLRLEPIKKMVSALSDSNPENGEQVKEIWLEFLRSEEFIDSVDNRIMQAVSFIDDDKARDFVGKLVIPVRKTVHALYDENPNNVEQIKEAWFEYLTDQESVDSFVAFFVKDEDKQEEVSYIVRSTLDTLFSILNAALA